MATGDYGMMFGRKGCSHSHCCCERGVRIEMQPKWMAVQASFIDRCGGDMGAMIDRAAERADVQGRR